MTLLQLIAFDKGVSVFGGLQFHKHTLRQFGGGGSAVFCRSRKVRAEVKLPVQPAVVKTLDEALYRVRVVYLAYVGEQVHVAEAVDGDKRQVGVRLAQVRQRVCEHLAVSVQEVYPVCGQRERRLDSEMDKVSKKISTLQQERKFCRETKVPSKM